eukprot:990154_1
MKTALFTLAIYISFIEPTICNFISDFPTVEAPTASPTLSPSTPTIATPTSDPTRDPTNDPTTDPTKQSIFFLVKPLNIDYPMFALNIETDRTILYIKIQIKKILKIPVEQQKLIFEAVTLENMKTLDAYNIPQQSTFYLIQES